MDVREIFAGRSAAMDGGDTQREDAWAKFL
jgi:hypothetical protein